MNNLLSSINRDVRQYLLVTFNYWNFTITDGALRMLVILHFHTLGYNGLEIAMLFLFYEFFGVVTNLLGGWIGARTGLNRTMNAGLALQILALSLLAVPPSWLSVPLVMFAQALSGIAKDLNKMSAKTSIKQLVSGEQRGQLFKWVAVLTGSKNALKGAGFFIGGALLALMGFRLTVLVMAGILALVLGLSLLWLDKDMGKAGGKVRFTQVFSGNRSINILSAARMFLFGARDIWFVVALPIYLSTVFGWHYSQTGAFMALWVMGYGVVQGIAPRITGNTAGRGSVIFWSVALLLISLLVALGIQWQWQPQLTIVVGLLAFGAVFAVNSSLHSYLIVHYAREEGASMDVGFYYMANAMGRLLGTVLSGVLFQWGGLSLCLWFSAGFIAITVLISSGLPLGLQDKRLKAQ